MRYEFDGGSLELDHDHHGTYYDDYLRRYAPQLEWFVDEVELDCGLRIDRKDPCHQPILQMHNVQPSELDVFFWDEIRS